MINQSKFERLKAEWSNQDRWWTHGYCWGYGGNGDLLYNTARQIIEENIDDPIADDMIIENIFDCLNEGKRWPDGLPLPITTTNHKQTDMTKDPWIMAYCCAIHLNRYNLINLNPPPTKPTGDKWRKWSYFLPNERAWYKALLGKDRAYRIWRRLIPYCLLPDHAYVLYGFMEIYYKKTSQI